MNSVRIWALSAAVSAGLAPCAAQAGSHQLLLSDKMRAVWVAPKGKAAECAGYPRDGRSMSTCPNFRPVSHTGRVDLVGKLWFVVRTANEQWRTDGYFVDPKYDVLPKGKPIDLMQGN